jgi:hypothetical protein
VSFLLGNIGSESYQNCRNKKEAEASNDLVVAEDDDLEEYEQNAVLSMDDASLAASSQDDGSLSTFDEFSSSSLSQYIFLNPRWLVAAVACILRHDLDSEIRETRRSFAPESRVSYSVYEGNLNCPVITAEDALMLWHNKHFTKRQPIVQKNIPTT